MTTHKLVVGATINPSDISYWNSAKIIDNAIGRAFPGGNGMIQPVTGAMGQYYLNSGTGITGGGKKSIALSTRIQRKWVDAGLGTWTAGMTNTINTLKSYIDAGYDEIWYVEDHEPCETSTGLPVLPPATYKNNYTKVGGVFAAINALPSTYRSKIKVGHCQARTWVDGNVSRSWSDYDTGLGDFMAADMYATSYMGSPAMTRNVYETPSTMISSFGSYKFNASDSRDRMFFELGSIGLPFDSVSGVGRDAWLQQTHQIVNTWDVASKGWNFLGWIFWNAVGASGNALAFNPGPPSSAAIGTARYFQLDRQQDGSGATDDGYVTLTGVNAKPLVRWQQIATSNNH